MDGGVHAFSRANRERQPILSRRIRTVERRVVVTEGMVGAVEIHVVNTGRGAIELEVSAAGIRLSTVSEIAKRDEQPAHVFLAHLDERGEGKELPLQREGKLADSLVAAAFA